MCESWRSLNQSPRKRYQRFDSFIRGLHVNYNEEYQGDSVYERPIECWIWYGGWRYKAKDFVNGNYERKEHKDLNSFPRRIHWESLVLF